MDNASRRGALWPGGWRPEGVWGSFVAAAPAFFLDAIEETYNQCSQWSAGLA
jgi:hypothetical protein